MTEISLWQPLPLRAGLPPKKQAITHLRTPLRQTLGRMMQSGLVPRHLLWRHRCL